MNGQGLKPRMLIIGAESSLSNVESVMWGSHSNTAVLLWPERHDSLDDYAVVVLVADHKHVQIAGARAAELARFQKNQNAVLIIVGSVDNLPNLAPGAQAPIKADGQTIEVKESNAAGWYGNVQRYSSFQQPPPERPQTGGATTSTVVHASTPTGETIGFTTRYTFAGQRGSSVVVLPSPTVGVAEDHIDNFLRGRFDLEEASPIPDWLDDRYSAPGQPGAQSEVAAARAKIAEAQQNLVLANDNLQNITRLSGLLYEQGTPLEDLIIEALVVLGATVLEEPTPSHHDGVIKAPSKEVMVLEAKGVKGSIALAHARQLEDWVTDISLERTEDAYPDAIGLLVGNPFRNTDPEARSIALLPSNVVTFMKSRDQRWLSTTSIFDALHVANAPTELAKWWASITDETENHSLMDAATHSKEHIAK